MDIDSGFGLVMGQSGAFGNFIETMRKNDKIAKEIQQLPDEIFVSEIQFVIKQGLIWKNRLIFLEIDLEKYWQEVCHCFFKKLQPITGLCIITPITPLDNNNEISAVYDLDSVYNLDSAKIDDFPKKQLSDNSVTNIFLEEAREENIDAFSLETPLPYFSNIEKVERIVLILSEFFAF
ncbi:hypothetical protein J7J81_02210 [bacterium]|nr:hypothetical protein [bacterium]